jgi:transcriptional regulator with XRE-family HTH domain
MKFKREFLKQKRKEKKITLVALAKKCGCSHSYLSYLEKGDRKNLSSLILYKLAKALDVKMESFFEEVEEEKKKTPYLFIFRREDWAYISKVYKVGILNKKTIKKIERKETKEEREEVLIVNIIKLEE